MSNRGSTGSKKGKGKGKGKGAAKAKPQTPPLEEEMLGEEEEEGPPRFMGFRYGNIEMDLIRIGLETNLANVLADAWKRWDRRPCAGAIPPPPPPKDPVMAQEKALAEHRRRLGRSAVEQPLPPAKGAEAASTAGAAAAASDADQKDATMIIEGIESPEEEKEHKTTEETDPCNILEQPCRRLFTGVCRPCPEPFMGVGRDPNKVCVCTMTPRPETRRDALRFLSLMPRGLNATFSSMDPARLEEERQRKKAEAAWRRRLEEQHERFEKAMRRAKVLVEAQEHVAQPPFVEQHNALTCARGMSTVPLIICPYFAPCAPT